MAFAATHADPTRNDSPLQVAQWIGFRGQLSGSHTIGDQNPASAPASQVGVLRGERPGPTADRKTSLLDQSRSRPPTGQDTMQSRPERRAAYQSDRPTNLPDATTPQAPTTGPHVQVGGSTPAMSHHVAMVRACEKRRPAEVVGSCRSSGFGCGTVESRSR